MPTPSSADAIAHPRLCRDTLDLRLGLTTSGCKTGFQQSHDLLKPRLPPNPSMKQIFYISHYLLTRYYLRYIIGAISSFVMSCPPGNIVPSPSD